MRKGQELTGRQQKGIAVTALAVFILLTVLLCWFAGRPLVRFASEPERFRLWVESHGLWGQLAFTGMVFLQVVAAIIPGEPFEIAAGYAFGAVEGTVLCLLGATAGSVLVFFLVRRFGVRLVETFFPKRDIQSLRFLQVSRRRTVLYLVVFMLPGTPKDLLCYFAGLTDIRFPVMLLICSLGRLPSVITSTLGGDALGTESYVLAVVVFAATLVVSVAGLLLYDRILRRRERENGAEDKERP